MSDKGGIGKGLLGSAATAVRRGVGERLGDLGRGLIVRGALAGVLGVCVLAWPGAGIAILARLVGLYLVIDGITELVARLRGSERGATVLEAVIGVAIGVALLVWPGVSARALLLAFGAWAVVTGVSLIVRARRRDGFEELRTVMTTVGTVLALFGVALLVWPGAGLVGVAWVIGIAGLLLAALLIFLALRIRKVRDRIVGR